MSVSPNDTHANTERQPFEPATIMIPAGAFVMGTSTLYLPDYWIGRWPVTVGDFAMFIRAGGYRSSDYWTREGWSLRFAAKWTTPRLWDDPFWSGTDRLPVIGVSWYEAHAYCRWLTFQSGRSYRLPLEAEWEKAARGPDGCIFPWGNVWAETRCNTLEARLGRTTPVDTFSPQGESPYGIADMAGNVWEWCRSGWVEDYVYPESGVPVTKGRVVRGGAWDQPQHVAQTTSRQQRAPDDSANSIGFRVVWSPESLDDTPSNDVTRRMAVSPLPPEPIMETDPDVQPPRRPAHRDL